MHGYAPPYKVQPSSQYTVSNPVAGQTHPQFQCPQYVIADPFYKSQLPVPVHDQPPPNAQPPPPDVNLSQEKRGSSQ